MDKLAEVIENDISPLFLLQILSVQWTFKSIIDKLAKVKQIASIYFIEYSTLANTYRNVYIACVIEMYLSIPVTVTMAE